MLSGEIATLVIFTDGSCEPNPGVGGWGWVRWEIDVVPDDFLETNLGNYDAIGVGGQLKATNNEMEIKAIYEALEGLETVPVWKCTNCHTENATDFDYPDNTTLPPLECHKCGNIRSKPVIIGRRGFHPVVIGTDSMYAIKALTDWVVKWRLNGWKTLTGEPVKNKELIQATCRLLHKHGVEIHHVPGHKGYPGNEMAHIMAHQGRKNAAIELAESIDLDD